MNLSGLNNWKVQVFVTVLLFFMTVILGVGLALRRDWAHEQMVNKANQQMELKIYAAQRETGDLCHPNVIRIIDPLPNSTVPRTVVMAGQIVTETSAPTFTVEPVWPHDSGNKEAAVVYFGTPTGSRSGVTKIKNQCKPR